MSKIHFIHPKFLGDSLVVAEHDFLHDLFDALTSESGEALEHPDTFRFKGRRGQLYIRHRKLAEEMDLRAIEHTTFIDRKLIDADEWSAPEIDDDEILKDAGLVRESGRGRFELPSTKSVEDYICPDDFTSVIPGVLEGDLLKAMWRIVRFQVMERSYTRYRALSETLQGKQRGSVWMLFDLMMEEAYSHPHEERAPAIAYETVWELLAEEATDEESARFKELMGELEPGKISLDMRRFLAAVGDRQGNDDIRFSAMLAPYIA